MHVEKEGGMGWGGRERENENRAAKMSFRRQNLLPLGSCECPLVKPLDERILGPQPLLQWLHHPDKRAKNKSLLSRWDRKFVLEHWACYGFVM